MNRFILILFTVVFACNFTIAQTITVRSGSANICADEELPTLETTSGNYNWYYQVINTATQLSDNSDSCQLSSKISIPADIEKDSTVNIIIEELSNLYVAYKTFSVDVSALPRKPVLQAIQTDVCETGEVTLRIYNSTDYFGHNLLWLPSNETDPESITIYDGGPYQVKATNPSSGCFNTGIINVNIDDCEISVYLPTAFTPADIVNQKFCASSERNSDEFTKFNLMIMNKWGDAVYKSDNIDECWDGNKSGSPCPEGVYIWILQYQSDYNSELRTLRGTITLLR